MHVSRAFSMRDFRSFQVWVLHLLVDSVDACLFVSTMPDTSQLLSVSCCLLDMTHGGEMQQDLLSSEQAINLLQGKSCMSAESDRRKQSSGTRASVQEHIENLHTSRLDSDGKQCRLTSCLRVEVVDKRQETGVEHAEVDVGLVADRFDGNGSNLDNEESELSSIIGIESYCESSRSS